MKKWLGLALTVLCLSGGPALADEPKAYEELLNAIHHSTSAKVQAVLAANPELKTEKVTNSLHPDKPPVPALDRALGATLLFKAKPDVMELLVKAGANVNSGPEMLVTKAIVNNYPEGLDFLLAHGADPNQHDQDGSAADALVMQAEIKAMDTSTILAMAKALTDHGGKFEAQTISTAESANHTERIPQVTALVDFMKKHTH